MQVDITPVPAQTWRLLWNRASIQLPVQRL